MYLVQSLLVSFKLASSHVIRLPNNFVKNTTLTSAQLVRDAVLYSHSSSNQLPGNGCSKGITIRTAIAALNELLPPFSQDSRAVER